MKKIILLSLLLGGVCMHSHAQEVPGDCEDLFISEYVEGSMKNQALEVYNPSPDTIDITPYTFKIYKGGAANNPTVVQLFGIIPPLGVHVCGNDQAEAALLNICDQTAPGLNFSGGDAVGLYRNDTLIDIIGEIGINPGPSGWQVGTGFTKDNTLRRGFDVRQGSPYWNVAQLQYQVLPEDTISGLGSHSCVCSSSCFSNKPTARFVSALTTVSEGVGSVDIFFNVDAAMPETGDLVVCECDPPDMATCGQTEDYTILAVKPGTPLPSAPQNFNGCPQEGGTTEGVCKGWFEPLLEGFSGNHFFVVTINDDNIVENEETICFELKKDQCIKIDNNNKQHIVKIQDNDAPPTFISDKESGNHGIKIHSNVNSGELNIKFTGQYSDDTEIQICNIVGQVIKDYRISGFQEKSSFTFDISVLEAGTYLLKVTQNNYSFFKKIIKL